MGSPSVGFLGFYNDPEITGHIFLRPSIWEVKSCGRIFSKLPTQGKAKEILYRLILPFLLALAFIPSVMLIPAGLIIKGISKYCCKLNTIDHPPLDLHDNSSPQNIRFSGIETSIPIPVQNIRFSGVETSIPIPALSSENREEPAFFEKRNSNAQSNDEGEDKTNGPLESHGAPIQKPKEQTMHEELTCPITLEPFVIPYILLEDGFTYEKDAINEALEANPGVSPMIRNIPSATLRPNMAVQSKNPVCPITKEPFVEPYYCLEDCQTYEKEAIISWFTSQVTQQAQIIDGELIRVKSPLNFLHITSGVGFTTLTLYPNKVLFKQGIPESQEPIRLNAMEIALSQAPPPSEFKCIRDVTIRNLIEVHSKTVDDQERNILKQRIIERRQQLGLETREAFWGGLDLSHLDLSDMILSNLSQKSTILKQTNFSNSLLINCGFSRCRFINCNLKGTTFKSCNFCGEETSFFRSDMQDVIIGRGCSIEKGNTWQKIVNWGEFIAELVSRGALNTDTVQLR